MRFNYLECRLTLMLVCMLCIYLCKLLRPLQHYRIRVLKTVTQMGPHFPRNARISDSRCKFFQSEQHWINIHGNMEIYRNMNQHRRNMNGKFIREISTTKMSEYEISTVNVAEYKISTENVSEYEISR